MLLERLRNEDEPCMCACVCVCVIVPSDRLEVCSVRSGKKYNLYASSIPSRVVLKESAY